MPTALDGLATEAQADEGEIGASSFGSGGGSNGGGPSGSDSDFRFVCINNNDNTAENGDETDQCTEDIEACFNQFLGRELTLTLKAALESPAGVTIDINGVNVTFESFEDLCSELRGLTFQQLSDAIVDIIEEAGIIAMIDIGLIECIAEVLQIVDHG